MRKEKSKSGKNTSKWSINRRDFLKASALTAAGFGTTVCSNPNKPGVRFGMVTDLHYAETEPRNNRYYRESIAKLDECVALMNEQKVDFLIETGDFKDEGVPPNEADTITYLQTIEKTFCQFKGPRYHVLGNHDMDSISKTQFQNNVENSNIDAVSSYYSFDTGGIHFIVLDANFNSDGSDYDHGNYDWTDANIPPSQLDWLENDLNNSAKPVIVFVHQLLDGSGDHFIRNATEVRNILQRYPALAVFQGHKHSGQHSLIKGIHYYTLKALVEGSGPENNAYAVVEVHNNLDITVNGYRRATDMELDRI